MDQSGQAKIQMKDERKVILLAFATGISVWVFDAILDPNFFSATFLEVLVLGGSGHDFLMRSFMFVSFMAFGFIISGIVKKRREAEEEKARLVEQLSNAINDIKTLSGLLPICSYCKKIRDDGGYWNQIETYIRKHSLAEFTHSICPECEKKALDEFARESRKPARGPFLPK